MPRVILFVISSLLLLQLSCKPRIFYFTAEPSRVTSKDSVLLKWKARGKPMMMFDQVMQANPQGDSLHLLEYSLYVTKGNKDPAHQKIQVLLLPGESQQVLALRVDSFVPTADTVIARTVADPATWKDFSVGSVSSFFNRFILITHSDRSGSLQDSITKSDLWRGQLYSGPWQISLPLNSEEKINHALIPSRILLKVSIIKTKP